MTVRSFCSIDQNSHSLWDTVPKLRVLVNRGLTGVHYVEDIDVAFTRRGVKPGDQAPLRLESERYYRDGTSDWGAALFYTVFLGRNPLNIRELEPYTGLSTRALARRLGLSVDQLYERFAGSDNRQLTGSSYLFDKQSHRLIGDLQTAEIKPYINELVDFARQDLQAVFPEHAACLRIGQWFDKESAFLQRLFQEYDHAPLTRLYQEWLRGHLGDKLKYGLTSRLFAVSSNEIRANPLFTAFLVEYEKIGNAYNEAIKETGAFLNSLDLERGELPFFAVWHRQGRMFRNSIARCGQTLYCGQEEWPLSNNRELPLEKMRKHGLLAIAGKALVMVVEARQREGGAGLALPEKGSLYMPTVYAWQRRLKRMGVKAADTLPVLRVKFNFLERLKEIRGVRIKPPLYLRRGIADETIELAEFAEHLPELRQQAEKELGEARHEKTREQLSNRLSPAFAEELRDLDRRKRQLAQNEETRPQASQVGKRIKELEQQKFGNLIMRLIDDFHISRVDYWNSRGALLPWAIAAGGEDFYQRLIEKAEIEEENYDSVTP